MHSLSKRQTDNQSLVMPTGRNCAESAAYGSQLILPHSLGPPRYAKSSTHGRQVRAGHSSKNMQLPRGSHMHSLTCTTTCLSLTLEHSSSEKFVSTWSGLQSSPRARFSYSFSDTTHFDVRETQSITHTCKLSPSRSLGESRISHTMRSNGPGNP